MKLRAKVPIEIECGKRRCGGCDFIEYVNDEKWDFADAYCLLFKKIILEYDGEYEHFRCPACLKTFTGKKGENT